MKNTKKWTFEVERTVSQITTITVASTNEAEAKAEVERLKRAHDTKWDVVGPVFFREPKLTGDSHLD